MCGVMAMGILYRLDYMVKYVCYMGFGSNGCFMVGIALTGGHYRTYIISGLGHPRLDSAVLLW